MTNIALSDQYHFCVLKYDQPSLVSWPPILFWDYIGPQFSCVGAVPSPPASSCLQNILHNLSWAGPRPGKQIGPRWATVGSSPNEWWRSFLAGEQAPQSIAPKLTRCDGEVKKKKQHILTWWIVVQQWRLEGDGLLFFAWYEAWCSFMRWSTSSVSNCKSFWQI